MGVRRELLASVGLLVLLNTLVSFGAVGLLTRMAPAIEHILRANVVSIEAAEQMLAVLAEAGISAQAEADRIERFRAALAQAQGNITEREEEPRLAQVQAHWRPALAGDPDARAQVIEALQGLVAINRQAMRDADAEAQRLGTAGAWSAVFIALLALLSSVGVVRHLGRRILRPLAELHDTVEAVRHGNPYRRCTIADAPNELRELLGTANWLLDALAQQGSQPADAARERAALAATVHLLNQAQAPCVVIDTYGEIAAAGRFALDRLGEDDGAQLREALAGVAHAEPGEDARGIRWQRLGQGEAWLCSLPPSQPRDGKVVIEAG